MSDEDFLRDVEGQLEEVGLHVSIVVRDLIDGRELAIAPKVLWPLASVAKVPLALAVLQIAARGDLDLAAPVPLPVESAGGSGGTDRFRHPATIAVDDLLSLALTVSDNRAADALLQLLPDGAVQRELEALALAGIAVEHPFRDLGRTPLERFAPADRHLAHTLAIRGAAPAAAHPLPQLDIGRTNAGTARALSALLETIWSDRGLGPDVGTRLRELMSANLIRHRLAPDLTSDSMAWSSKTGTLLHLRHEIGVVEHEDGERYAVVVLSRSSVAASAQPAAEAALGAAARALHQRLRGQL